MAIPPSIDAGTCDTVDATDPVPGGLVDDATSAGATPAPKVSKEFHAEDIPCLAGLESLAQFKSATADSLRTGLTPRLAFRWICGVDRWIASRTFLSQPLRP